MGARGALAGLGLFLIPAKAASSTLTWLKGVFLAWRKSFEEGLRPPRLPGFPGALRKMRPQPRPLRSSSPGVGQPGPRGFCGRGRCGRGRPVADTCGCPAPRRPGPARSLRLRGQRVGGFYSLNEISQRQQTGREAPLWNARCACCVCQFGAARVLCVFFFCGFFLFVFLLELQNCRRQERLSPHVLVRTSYVARNCSMYHWLKRLKMQLRVERTVTACFVFLLSLRILAFLLIKVFFF